MIWRIRVNSCAANPWFRASINGSSQNLQVFRSRSTWTWGGSLQSKLVKKNRYGPGMPLTRGTQGLQFFHLAVIPAFSFQAANEIWTGPYNAKALTTLAAYFHAPHLITSSQKLSHFRVFHPFRAGPSGALHCKRCQHIARLT